MLKIFKLTWESTVLNEETAAPNIPEANSSTINLTDLSMGKIEPSPAFSRL